MSKYMEGARKSILLLLSALKVLSLPSSSSPVDYYYCYYPIPSSNLLPRFPVYACLGNTEIFILLTSVSGIMRLFGI